MLLRVDNLTKTYGATIALRDVSFVVDDKDRVGVIGVNGVGKSTLLRILAGFEPADSGRVSTDESVDIGILTHPMSEFYGSTLEDMVLESLGGLRQLEDRMHRLETDMENAIGGDLDPLLEEYGAVSVEFTDRGGYQLNHRIERVLHGLGISHLALSRRVDSLSGGEKSRVYLATLLLRSPKLLLLDEPSNHLDLQSLEWLEEYLSEHKGAYIVVSHDRRFLNTEVVPKN